MTILKTWQNDLPTKLPATNIVLAIGGLNCFVSTEVQNSTFVLRIKFGAKNPAHRQYATVTSKRKKDYAQYEHD